MKRKVLICVIIGLLLVALIGGILLFSGNEDYDGTELRELTMKYIQVEEIGRIKEIEGEAELLITMPDFSGIYADAVKDCKTEKEILKYIKNALKNEEFERVQVTTKTLISTENGKEVVHIEEAVSRTLEDELIKAINVAGEVIHNEK